jgi:hypothetical protein
VKDGQISKDRFYGRGEGWRIIVLLNTNAEFSFKEMVDGSYCVMGYQGDAPHVVIPDSHNERPVTILFDNLFSGHQEIETVHIPDTVTNIGGFIFEGCTSLHHVELPAKLENLWRGALAHSSLEEVVIPDGVTSLVIYVFKDCKQLKKVVCGKGLKTIGAYAFSGCDKLTDLVCGPDTEISPQAFEENPYLLKGEHY